MRPARSRRIRRVHRLAVLFAVPGTYDAWQKAKAKSFEGGDVAAAKQAEVASNYAD